MKFKHWQGYGCVNAKVVERRCNSYNNFKLIKILVYGNHECGIDRSEDKYDIYNWLLKRFVKDCKDYKQITNIDFNYTDDVEGQEAGIYEIEYEAN